MIRDATIEDLDAIVAMGEDFLKGSLFGHHIPTRPTALRAFAERLVTMEDATILLALEGDLPVGMLALVVWVNPMFDERVATEFAWWVHPDRRGIGVRLLKRGTQWGKDHGATALQMGAPNDKVARFYEACGFELVEMLYQKVIA
jgi:GNAT superfamily N-acetyltransferase